HALTGSRPEQRDQDPLQVFPLGKSFLQGLSRSHARAFDVLKYRRLFHPQTDVERHRNQKDRNNKRQSPSPGGKCFFAHVVLQRQDDHQRNKQAEGGGDLNETGEEPAPLIRHVLGDIDRRASVFTTEGQALQHPDQQQQDGRGHTNRGVSRQKTDQRGGAAHDEQGHEKSVLASDQVADASEKERPKRAHDKADRKRREISDQRNSIIALGI